MRKGDSTCLVFPTRFRRGRFSGLLPERTGVELLGGPYLHAALTTNFTQFGEGALFGKADWGREDFVTICQALSPRGDPLLEPPGQAVLPVESRSCQDSR